MRHAMAILLLALGTAPAMAGDGALDWLAGHWCGGPDGRRVEELWLPEAGGSLLGLSRTLRDGKPASFEFLRIVAEGDAARYEARPNGVPAVAFDETARGDGWIRFENPAHDFPKRIEYRRQGERLNAAIAGPGPDGVEVRIPFDYARCAQ